MCDFSCGVKWVCKGYGMCYFLGLYFKGCFVLGMYYLVIEDMVDWKLFVLYCFGLVWWGKIFVGKVEYVYKIGVKGKRLLWFCIVLKMKRIGRW